MQRISSGHTLAASTIKENPPCDTNRCTNHVELVAYDYLYASYDVYYSSSLHSHSKTDRGGIRFEAHIYEIKVWMEVRLTFSVKFVVYCEP